MSVRPYNARRRRAFNPATKKLFEYGLIGLAIGAVLIAGLQLRPQTVFPTYGTLEIKITSGVPVAQLSIQAPMTGCHGHCNATSVSVNVTSIEVHTSGIDNMTGEWTQVCTKQLPMTLNLSQIMNVTKDLCGASIQPDTITNIRLDVSSATAEFPGQGATPLIVPSGKLEIPVSPLANVQAGKTTAIFVELQPHVVCPGSGYGNCKLTPTLQAVSSGPD